MSWFLIPAEMHHGLSWSTMVDHEFLYHGKTMVYHGKTMVNHGWDMASRLTMVRPWLSMVQEDGCPRCKTMVVHGARPWYNKYHGWPWCKTWGVKPHFKTVVHLWCLVETIKIWFKRFAYSAQKYSISNQTQIIMMSFFGEQRLYQWFL